MASRSFPRAEADSHCNRSVSRAFLPCSHRRSRFHGSCRADGCCSVARFPFGGALRFFHCAVGCAVLYSCRNALCGSGSFALALLRRGGFHHRVSACGSLASARADMALVTAQGGKSVAESDDCGCNGSVCLLRHAWRFGSVYGIGIGLFDSRHVGFVSACDCRAVSRAVCAPVADSAGCVPAPFAAFGNAVACGVCFPTCGTR